MRLIGTPLLRVVEVIVRLLNQRAKYLGYDLTKPELQELYDRFTRVADHRKKGLMDEEIVSLIHEIRQTAMGAVAD